MPEAGKKRKFLTLAEAAERLKKNPDDPDPEIQQYKKSSEELARIFELSKQSVVEAVERVTNAQDFLKSTVEAIQITNVLSDSILMQVQSVSETLRSTIVSIEAFVPPPLLLTQIQRVEDDFQQLIKPMQAIGQIFATQYTPTLYYKLPVLQNTINVPVQDIPKVQVAGRADIEKKLASESKTLHQETVRLEKESLTIEGRNYHYDYLRTTFVVWQTNIAALNLASIEDGMRILFETFYECLREKGVLKESYTEVFIPMCEILTRVMQKGKKDVSGRWVINTRSNIVKKIAGSRLSDILRISEYDTKLKGYWFRVAAHVYIPKLGSA